MPKCAPKMKPAKMPMEEAMKAKAMPKKKKGKKPAPFMGE